MHKTPHARRDYTPANRMKQVPHCTRTTPHLPRTSCHSTLTSSLPSQHSLTHSHPVLTAHQLPQAIHHHIAQHTSPPSNPTHPKSAHTHALPGTLDRRPHAQRLHTAPAIHTIPRRRAIRLRRRRRRSMRTIPKDVPQSTRAHRVTRASWTRGVGSTRCGKRGSAGFHERAGGLGYVERCSFHDDLCFWSHTTRLGFWTCGSVDVTT